jgi:DNA-binding response OmpR family regulator
MGDDRGRRRVLVVDDSATALEIASAALAQANFEVETLQSVFDLQMVLDSYKPHVLVLDLNMPALRGDLALNVLRRNAIHTCPVLLYSSTEEAMLRVRAMAAKADAYVRKSSDPSRLVMAVHQLANRERR